MACCELDRNDHLVGKHRRVRWIMYDILLLNRLVLIDCSPYRKKHQESSQGWDCPPFHSDHDELWLQFHPHDQGSHEVQLAHTQKYDNETWKKFKWSFMSKVITSSYTNFRQIAMGTTSTVLPRVTLFAVKNVILRPANVTSLGMCTISGDRCSCKGPYTSCSYTFICMVIKRTPWSVVHYIVLYYHA